MDTQPHIDALELECLLRFIELCTANIDQSPPTNVDLYVEGFWACVEALKCPRTVAELQVAIGAHTAGEESRRALQMARAAGLDTP